MTIGVQGVAQLVPLFRELNDLKRIRQAERYSSIAERLFVRAWHRLVHGADLRTVALSETAHAVAAARLAGIDAQVMADAGLSPQERLTVLRRSVDSLAEHLHPDLRNALHNALSPAPVEEVSFDAVPSFVHQLARQPRAGATRPGFARVVLEPTENHAEHCAIVAVQCVLSCPLYGADEGSAFLTGLSHHLHNARLPDAGDAGDHLLGEHLQPMMERFRALAIEALPTPLHAPVREALESVFRSDTPESKAFQTADSLDRVLEMEWHARSAAFTLDVALKGMDIIHPGPVQAFQLEVMKSAGLI